MSMQQINQIAPIDRSPEHVWGMALFSFRTSTVAICDLAKSPDYRDMAVDDLTDIAEAVLAVNLMWSQLQARRAA